MQAGKVPPDILQKVVFSRLGVRRPDVLVHARLGEDSAVIDFGPYACVVSTDPITGAGANIGWLAVHVSCNDVATMGAEPIGVLSTLLLPERTTEEDIRQIVSDIHRAAVELGVEVLGGHTEITPDIPNPILSLTSIGRAHKSHLVTSGGARPGDEVILTKSAALEGTAILASDFADFLRDRIPAETLRSAQQLIKRISVVTDGVVAAKNGATAMHDPTEGGVLGALYELAEASGVGLEIQAEQIPILPETRQIVAIFGVDPLRLISSGALLITARSSAPIVEALSQQGVPATVIGRATDGDRILVRDGQRFRIEPPERDELWRVLEAFPPNAGD